MDGDLVDRNTISQAIRRRSEYARRVGDARTPGQRLADFARIQQVAFSILRASPNGYHHFVRRNYRARRVEVINGQFRPVLPDRRTQQP